MHSTNTQNAIACIQDSRCKKFIYWKRFFKDCFHISVLHEIGGPRARMLLKHYSHKYISGFEIFVMCGTPHLLRRILPRYSWLIEDYSLFRRVLSDKVTKKIITSFSKC